jgi:hypothetical protein
MRGRGFFMGMGVLFFLSPSASTQPSLVHFDLLNKVSAKKIPLVIPSNSSVVIHDLRITPGVCRKEKDSFSGESYRVPLQILLEQDQEEPVELYTGELSSSTRFPHPPIEHALYDLILVSCESQPIERDEMVDH